MELRLEINYKQLLKLIHQLPKKEMEKLSMALQSEIANTKSSKSLLKTILDAPTWTDAEFHEYNEARNHMNQSRIA